MSDRLDQISGEADLLARARHHDPEAVDALYADHIASARHVAMLVAGVAAADDLVADSFARVIAQLHAGRGPSENFRSYLHATIRNRGRDLHRRARRERPASHQPWILEDGLGPVDGPEARIERTVDDEHITAAFDSLPEDWREVLWHLELRDRPVAEVAAMMDLTPAAVSSLAYRAREGLRLAYLDQMVARLPQDPDCQWTRDRLSRYLRSKLSPRAESRIEAHLDECAACATAIADLDQTNRKLAALLLPALAAAGAHVYGGPAGVSLNAATTATATTSTVVAGHSSAISALASWKTALAAVLMTGIATTPTMSAAAAAPTRDESVRSTATADTGHRESSTHHARRAPRGVAAPLTPTDPAPGRKHLAEDTAPPAWTHDPADECLSTATSSKEGREAGPGPVNDSLTALENLAATALDPVLGSSIICQLAGELQIAPGDPVDPSVRAKLDEALADLEVALNTTHGLELFPKPSVPQAQC